MSDKSSRVVETIPHAPTQMQKATTTPAIHYSVMNHLQEASYSSNESSSKAELTMFHQQTLGPPPKSTLLQAIANNKLKSFHGETDKGHMIRTRKGL